MTIKGRVYLSSTTEDLGEVRKDLAEQLRGIGYEPVYMGQYSADNCPPVEKVLADVASCQFYIGLFAFRYGEPVASRGRSHTELEYREAKDHGLPTLIFVLDERVEDWPIRWIDRGERGVMMERLRSELLAQTTHTVCLFERTKDLLKKVPQALLEQAIATRTTSAPRPTGAANTAAGEAVVGLRFQDVRNFKDRQEELEQMQQWLIDQRIKLLCVAGRSGVGKTAVVSRLGEQLEDGQASAPGRSTRCRADGIVYFRCRRGGATLAERLFYDICRLLPPNRAEYLRKVWTDAGRSDEERFQELAARFQSGCYVIFLDSFEAVLGQDHCILDESLRTFVEVCLRTPHALRLVTTSDQTFSVPHDVRHYVKAVNLDRGLPEPDAVALLRELDPDGDCGLLHSPEETLLRVVVRCRGLPRALIGTVQLLSSDPTLSVEQLLADDAIWERQDRTLVEEQYDRQSRDRQCILEALSVYDRPVPGEAVMHLVGRFFPRVDAPGCLRDLAGSQVIAASRKHGTYEIQTLLQEYAYGQIPTEGESYHRQACHRAAADYFSARRLPHAAWKTIDDVQPQLEEFSHRIRGGQFDLAADVLEKIDDEYLQVWGRYRQLIQMREQLLERLTIPRHIHQNHGSLALSYRRVGRLKDAVIHLQQAIDHAAEDPLALANWHTELGNTLADLVEMSRAIEEYKQAIAIAQASHDLLTEARALGNLAIAHRQLGQIDDAIRYYHEAIERDRRLLADVTTVSEKRSAQRWYATHVGNLGKSLLALGQIHQASDRLDEAIALMQELGHKYGEACNIHHRGEAAILLGDAASAVGYFRDAIHLLRELGETRNLSYAMLMLASAHYWLAESAEARRVAHDGLKLDVPETRYAFLVLMGIFELSDGQSTAGHALLSQAVAVCNELLAKTPHFYEALYGRALAELACGQTDASLQDYQLAQTICPAAGVRHTALGELRLLARAAPQTPGLDAARRLLMQDLPPLA